MKRRLPVDIEFLVESLLSEDPDGVYDENGDDLAAWYDQDAYAFMIFDNFFAVERGAKHYNIVEKIALAAKSGTLSSYLSSPMAGQLAISSIAGLEKELKSNSDLAKYVNKKSGFINYRKIGITGRLWTKKKLISFWNSEAKVVDNWDRVVAMFDEPKFKNELGDLYGYMVDFVERNWDTSEPLVPASSIGTGKHEPAKDDKQLNFLSKLDDKQLELVQQKLHTMKPEEKAKALKAMGAQNYKAAEIADKLGMSVAEFNHLMQVNEDSDSLVETPDKVYDNAGEVIAKWYTKDNYTFFLFEECAVYTDTDPSLGESRYTHYSLVKMMMGASTQPDPVAYLKKNKIIVTNGGAFLSSLKSGKIGKLIEFIRKETDNGRDDPPESAFDRVRDSYGLSGRVWKEVKTISFWNSPRVVESEWDRVEKFFANGPDLGSLDEYKVDYGNRDSRERAERRPLDLAKKISAKTSAKKSSSGESLGKLLSNEKYLKKMNKQMMKHVRGRLHTLPPEEKKKALDAMGYQNTKAADIAAKLGMTVAEFNHIMQVNEDISLSEIAKRITKK